MSYRCSRGRRRRRRREARLDASTRPLERPRRTPPLLDLQQQSVETQSGFSDVSRLREPPLPPRARRHRSDEPFFWACGDAVGPPPDPPRA